MGERVPVGARADEDVIADFREFVEDKKGQVRGEMGRELENAMIEYMDNDRSARIEEKVDELHEMMEESLSEESLDGERETATSSNGQSDDSDSGRSINQRTRDSLNAIKAEIPKDTTISASLLESAIEEHAGHSYKTLQRYKDMLIKRGEILEHPVEPQKYVTSQKTYAVVCEHSDRVKPPELRDLIAERMDRLGEEWYLDALPRALLENNQNLKVDHVMETEPYREDHGLLDGDRVGFQ